MIDGGRRELRSLSGEDAGRDLREGPTVLGSNGDGVVDGCGEPGLGCDPARFAEAVEHRPRQPARAGGEVDQIGSGRAELDGVDEITQALIREPVESDDVGVCDPGPQRQVRARGDHEQRITGSALDDGAERVELVDGPDVVDDHEQGLAGAHRQDGGRWTATERYAVEGDSLGTERIRFCREFRHQPSLPRPLHAEDQHQGGLASSGVGEATPEDLQLGCSAGEGRASVDVQLNRQVGSRRMERMGEVTDDRVRNALESPCADRHERERPSRFDQRPDDIRDEQLTGTGLFAQPGGDDNRRPVRPRRPLERLTSVKAHAKDELLLRRSFVIEVTESVVHRQAAVESADAAVEARHEPVAGEVLVRAVEIVEEAVQQPVELVVELGGNGVAEAG